MPKKTKKQKIRATIHNESRSPHSTQNEITSMFEPTAFSFVNREFQSSKTSEADQARMIKRVVNSNQTAILASTRKDLIKTFILASFILLSEAMLYFFWK